MRELVSGLRVLHSIGPKEARKVATMMLVLIEAKMQAGESVDLGFMKIDPQKSSPRVVHSNISKTRHFIGESVKWRIMFRESWLKKRAPLWSRHV